jgi:hypothetical protein
MTPMNVLDAILSQTAKLLDDKTYNYFAESKIKTENEIQKHYHHLHIISDEKMHEDIMALEASTENYLDFAKQGKILTVYTAGDLNVFNGVEFSAKVETNMAYEINDDIMVYEHKVKEKVLGYLYRKYYEDGAQPDDLNIESVRKNLKIELYNEIVNNEDSFKYFGSNQSVSD